MRVTDCIICNNKTIVNVPARIVRLRLHLNMSVHHLYRYELHWLLIEERVIFKILWSQPSPQAHVTKKVHRFSEVRGPAFHMFCISMSLVQIGTY